jgi:hypothetical protein
MVITLVLTKDVMVSAMGFVFLLTSFMAVVSANAKYLKHVGD